MSSFRIAAVVGLAALPAHAVERYFGVSQECQPIFEDSAEYKAQAAAYAACATGAGPLLDECKHGIAAKVYAGLIGPGQAHDQAFVDCLKWEPGFLGQTGSGTICKTALSRLLTVPDQAAYTAALAQCDSLVVAASIAKCKINTYNIYQGRLPLESQSVVGRCLNTFSQLDNRVDFTRHDVPSCYLNLGKPYALGENINIPSLFPQVLTWYITSKNEVQLGKFEACLTAKLGGMSDTCRDVLGVSPAATDEEVATAFLGLSKADRAEFLRCKALFPAHAGRLCDEILMSNDESLEVTAKCNNCACCDRKVRNALWSKAPLSKQDAFNTCKSILVDKHPASGCVTWEVAKLMASGGLDAMSTCTTTHLNAADVHSCFLEQVTRMYVSLNGAQRANIRAQCIGALAGM